MIMRSVRRRRLSQLVNATALVLAGAVLFTPKLETWPSPELVVMLFAPQGESVGAG
ncbi:MAG TPA: hypothetical protein VGB81_15810 [Devosia sp.]|jgi:hypothetical protein